MKKILTRILGIIFVLVIGYQQVCYADVIDTSDVLFTPLAFLVGFIGVIVLVVSAISFFALKSTVNKQNGVDYDKEKLNSLSEEEITKKKNKIQRRVYLWSMILSIIGLIYLGENGEISIITFFIPILLFVISIIVRLNKNKKLSNKICAISVALVCIIALWGGVSNKIVENYNKQFLQYQNSESNYWASPRYVSDVKGLINSAIENNKSVRKVTLVYQNINYTSADELRQLLSKLDTSKKYSMVTKYDNNYDYIEAITLSSYVNEYLRDLLSYEGNNQRGSSVKALIQHARSKVASQYYEEIEINIVYTDEIEQTRTVNVSTNNSQEITKLFYEIQAGKTYIVEIQNDSDDICNIIITCNN